MRLPVPPSLVPLSAALVLAALGGTAQAAATSAEIDYGRDIRPLLSENCFHCHGQDANRRKGKLRLDTFEGQRGKDVVIPGRPDDSELVKRIRSADPDEQMPPPESHRALSDDQQQLLRRWIAEGAPFDGHWAFSAPQRPAEPVVRAAAWVRNPIDRFVLARLESAALAPAPEADQETLVRRLSLDLTGLPPTPAEVDAFLADGAPGAYERVVDRLLASPHYGERMALPWLDAARYADSNGFQQDGDTFQWVWRDWVVKSFNDDLPFDRFAVEQLAGDLLPDATREQRLATGFVRCGLLNGEGGNIAEEQRYVLLFDRVDTTATTFLGLTMACAQCHDHKYDPITQRDYYSWLAAFNNVPESGTAGHISQRLRPADPLLDAASPEQRERKTAAERAVEGARAALQRAQSAWEERAAGDGSVPDDGVLDLLRRCGDPADKARADALKAYFEAHVADGLDGRPLQAVKAREGDVEALKDDYPMVMVMSDAKPRETHVLERGNYEKPLTAVEIAPPGFLPPLPAAAPRNRLGLARWLVAAEQPLTARVMANRIWQMFFGLGLVKTAEDFGVQSEPPLHRALLDWLAVDFREGGWGMKRLVRLVVTSATYRQSSRVTADLLERDPENRLFARASRFRLPAMLIRDQALAASGLLVPAIGGKPVYPYQPADIWDALAITKERDFTYPQSSGPDLYRRSLYTFWRRTVAPANMFDASARQTCKVRTATTSTPLHALTTLNDPTFVEAARLLAERTMAEPAERRLATAFRRVLARWPDAAEEALLARSLAKQRARFHADPASATAFLAVGATKADPAQDAVELAAHAAVCLAILNLDETVSRQ
jgi:mono/diheme cytochrome c family protein